MCQFVNVPMCQLKCQSHCIIKILLTLFLLAPLEYYYIIRIIYYLHIILIGTLAH